MNNKFLNPSEVRPRPEDVIWLVVMAAKRGEAGTIADVLYEYDLKSPPTRFRLVEAPDIRAEGPPRTRGYFEKKVEEKKRQQVEKSRYRRLKIRRDNLRSIPTS